MLNRSRKFDLITGVALLATALVLVGVLFGISKALWFMCTCVLCAVIPRLWASSFGYFTILLLPAVLLQYLLPKALRASVKALPSATSPADSKE